MFSLEVIADRISQATGKKPTYSSVQDAIRTFRELASTTPEIAEALAGPLPGRGTAATAYNGLDTDYIVGGIVQANSLYKLIKRQCGDTAPLRILDFGCGAARIIRYFSFFAPEHRYYACEVNRAAVTHTKEVSSKIDVREIQSEPPSTFESGSMDAIYAWSIWSHFDEKVGRAWLEELHRILKPDGCALITVHTDELVERYGSEPKLVERMKQRKGNYQKIRAQYEKSGFSYWSAYPKSARDHGIDNQSFGMAFISRDYISRNWTDLFNLHSFEVGVPGWQDIVVLSKSSSS